MSRVKVKQMKSVKNDELNSLFKQMMGIEDGDPEICKKKFDIITKALGTHLTIYKIIYTTFGKQQNLESIDSYAKELNAFLSATTKYKDLKESKFTINAVKVCNELAPHKSNFIEDKTNHEFIIDNMLVHFRVLPFSKFCAKQLFVDAKPSEREIELLLMCFKKLFTSGKSIYDQLMTADINIKDFKVLISSSLDTIQKLPELHRCKDAFNAIKKSLDMFECKFGEYYGDFMETGDSTIIMQNFIVDVADSTNSSPTVTMQFKKIINYYEKLSSQTKNKKTSSILEQISSHLGDLKF